MSKSEKTQNEKPVRRVRGEGSVFQRPDGRWVASIPLPNRKRKVEYYDDRKQAERARRRMLRELEDGHLITGRDQLLDAYLDHWLGIQKEVLKKGTYSMYHRYLTNRVISSLGHVKLQDLTGDMFQTLYARWSKEKMSPNTIRLIHTIIKKALDDAVRLRKLPLNPVRDAEPPRANEKEMQVLDIVQAKKLLEAAKDTRLDCLLHVALLGLRRGELLGLQWHDIDFERKELKIGRSLSYIHDPETKHHEFVLDTPKTASSRRVLHLPQFILDSLVEHRELHQRKQSHAQEWRKLDLIFCSDMGGYLHPNNLSEGFDRLLKKTGLPDIRFHDLRHSAVTIWIALGVNPKVIQEVLGHSDISITLGVYSHILPTMHKQAMNHLDVVFGNPQEKED